MTRPLIVGTTVATLGIACVLALLELEALDRALYLLISRSWRNELADAVMVYVSDKRHFVVPGMLLLGVWLAGGRWRQKLKLVLLGGLVVLATDAAATFAKKLIARPRPCTEVLDTLLGCGPSFSFPSNHAANFFAFAAFVATVTSTGRWAWFLLAALVAYSRVYVGVHYPADVIAGALLGTGIGMAGGQAARLLQYPAAPSLSLRRIRQGSWQSINAVLSRHSRKRAQSVAAKS